MSEKMKKDRKGGQNVQEVNLRSLSLDIVTEVLEDGVHLDTALHHMLKKWSALDKRDRSFISRLVKGTVERAIEMDYLLDLYSSVKVKKMKPLIRNLLRISVYQIRYMEQVPQSAVCNEAVKIANKRKFHNLSGFVNGILRKISREKESLSFPKREDGFVRYASVCYSMPEWIVRMWQEQCGEEKTEAMLQYFLNPASLTVRYAGNDKKAWEEELKQAGIAYEQSKGLSYAYRLQDIDTVTDIPGYKEGRFTVQDESSMLVAQIAGICPGMKIIDVCAAPGGKAMHAAALAGGDGLVSARDLTDYKVKKIIENAKRMQIKNMQVKVQDACLHVNEDEESADIVFADVPCSGLGVLGKKCDIKYHATQESLYELQQLQRKIITNAVSYVKKGGTFVYSTCTIHSGENEEQVEWMLQNFPLKPVPFYDELPHRFKEAVKKEGYLQLLAGDYDTDGFFIAKFEKL